MTLRSWLRSLFARTRLENLDDKPSCQKSYRDAYSKFMQPSFASREYYRLYYRLHADVDRHLGEVIGALEASRFADDTIIVFTSDHGDLLGAHGGLHQKWYMAYEEAVRVPLVVVLPKSDAPAGSVSIPTSHIDIAPTLLGLAGADAGALRETLAPGFTDALPLVGRDLHGYAGRRVRESGAGGRAAARRGAQAGRLAAVEACRTGTQRRGRHKQARRRRHANHNCSAHAT